MYVLDSTVLQQGVSDSLFERQWEIYQSRVSGDGVGPVPYKSVAHYWEDISSISAAEIMEQVEPSDSEIVVNSATSSQPEQEVATESVPFTSELTSNDQLPQPNESLATELPVEEANEIALADTTVNIADLEEIPESLAEAKSGEIVEKERYLLQIRTP